MDNNDEKIVVDEAQDAAEEQQEQKFCRNLKHKKKIWKNITYRIWSRKL